MVQLEVRGIVHATAADAPIGAWHPVRPRESSAGTSQQGVSTVEQCPFCASEVTEQTILYGGTCGSCFAHIPGEEAATDPGEDAKAALGPVASGPQKDLLAVAVEYVINRLN